MIVQLTPALIASPRDKIRAGGLLISACRSAIAWLKYILLAASTFMFCLFAVADTLDSRKIKGCAAAEYKLIIYQSQFHDLLRDTQEQYLVNGQFLHNIYISTVSKFLENIRNTEICGDAIAREILIIRRNELFDLSGGAIITTQPTLFSKRAETYEIELNLVKSILSQLP
jgi:hypothetical protein